MKRQDGEVRQDYDHKLDELILDLIFEKKAITTDRIRNILNKRYARKLGWITIKRHIDYLLKRERIILFYENEEAIKKVRLYKIK